MAGFSLTALVRKAPFLAAVNAKEKALQAVISAQTQEENKFEYY